MRNKSDVVEIEKLKAKNEQLEQTLVYMKEFYENEIESNNSTLSHRTRCC